MLKKFFISCLLVVIAPLFVLEGQSKTTVYQGQTVAAKRIIVKMKSKYKKPKKILHEYSVQSVRRISANDNSAKIWQNLYIVKLKHKKNLAKVIKKLNNNHKVKYAEPDYILTTEAIPNDTNFSFLWAMNNTGQSSGTVDADIDATEAWDISYDCSAVAVGVIDTGIDYNHADLVANMWQNPGEIAGDGVDNDKNGYVDDIYGYDFANNDNNPMDDNSHGTHVAGTIGGIGNNAVGVAGVCWNVKLVALKFMTASGSGYSSNAIKAINYAHQMGIKITNNSWGGTIYSQSLYDAIKSVQDEQIFIAAAGNSSVDIDSTPFYPSAYNLPNIISVTATNRTDAQVFNYGAVSVDIGAPGSSIYSTIPGGYGTKSGTSMATPHVAGAAALIWSYQPALSNLQIKETLMNSGDSIVSLAGKTVSGKRLNINNALLSLTHVNQPPIAEAGAEQNIYLNDAVTLDGSASTDADGTIASYSWNMLDDNILSGQSVSYTYMAAGDYNVILTIADNEGATATDTVLVHVLNHAPTVEIGGPYTVNQYSETTFIAQVSDPRGDALSYTWNFGDGLQQTSATNSISHTYNVAGIYQLDVDVTDGTYTVIDSAQVNVDYVNRQPVANIGGPYSGDEDEAITLDASLSSDPDNDALTYHWNFGDGISDIASVPTASHVYTTNGSFVLTLIVNDGNLNSESVSTAVTVNAPPAEADALTVSTAEFMYYSMCTGRLHVVAYSTSHPNAILTIEGYGDMSIPRYGDGAYTEYYRYSKSYYYDADDKRVNIYRPYQDLIIINSSFGGSITVPVECVGDGCWFDCDSYIYYL